MWMLYLVIVFSGFVTPAEYFYDKDNDGQPDRMTQEECLAGISRENETIKRDVRFQAAVSSWHVECREVKE